MENIDTVFMAKALIFCTLLGMYLAYRWIIWRSRYHKLTKKLDSNKDVTMKPKSTEKYLYCNHHHEIGNNHSVIDFGDGEFVVNNEAIPLLKVLNEVGLRTRTHHLTKDKAAFVGILLDNVRLEVKKVNESAANRTKYNGKTELLISWDRPQT